MDNARAQDGLICLSFHSGLFRDLRIEEGLGNASETSSDSSWGHTKESAKGDKSLSGFLCFAWKKKD